MESILVTPSLGWMVILLGEKETWGEWGVMVRDLSGRTKLLIKKEYTW